MTTKETMCNTDSAMKDMFLPLRRCVLCLLFFLLLTACSLPAAFAAEKWQGVDESVVEKYAKEHGREAARPLIDIEQGDLPLFLFLLAGTVGGFAAGYYWRRLIEPNALKKEDRKE